jgi:hypothetical protein
VNRVAPEQGTYELLLHFADGREELRLGDHLDRFLHDDTTLMLRGRPWRIVSEVRASMTSAVSRLVCEPRSAPVGLAAPASTDPDAPAGRAERSRVGHLSNRAR